MRLQKYLLLNAHLDAKCNAAIHSHINLLKQYTLIPPVLFMYIKSPAATHHGGIFERALHTITGIFEGANQKSRSYKRLLL